LPNKELDAVPP